MTYRNELQKPPFRLHLSETETAPKWIFSSPHSGDFYPPEFIAASLLNAHDLRRSEDSHIETLLADMPSKNACVLAAVYPRAFLDLNRAPFELDPTMFDAALPDYVDTTSQRVRFGLGTIAKIVADGMPIYRDKLAFETIKARIEALYTPFHEALKRQVEKALAAHGEAFLLDIHSMPSNAVTAHAGDKKPDIIIGDCHGTSCSQALTLVLQNYFTALGLRVALNKPYAGGFITQTYGASPKEGAEGAQEEKSGKVQAVQIEISRALYMNEQSYAPHDGLNTLRNQLTDLAQHLKQHEAQFSGEKTRKAAE